MFFFERRGTMSMSMSMWCQFIFKEVGGEASKGGGGLKPSPLHPLHPLRSRSLSLVKMQLRK